jgi:hypothetical protein
MENSPCANFYSMLCVGKERELINYLQRRNLLPTRFICSCQRSMSIQSYTRSPDRHVFRCISCGKTKNIRQGPFFDEPRSRLPLRKIIELVFHWICNIPVTAAASLVEVSPETAVQWYAYCRDICSKIMVGLDDQLGLEGKIVEIDETLMFKRKNNMGRVVQQFWIFGMYEIETKRGYLLHVHDRTADTLVPIIKRWIAPGSTIHSDGWLAYSNLSLLGYNHLVVNHRKNFVDPQTGACTNHVESFWSRIKKSLKHINSSQGEMRWRHLDEALYRDWFKFKKSNIWSNLETFFSHAAVHSNSCN